MLAVYCSADQANASISDLFNATSLDVELRQSPIWLSLIDVSFPVVFLYSQCIFISFKILNILVEPSLL